MSAARTWQVLLIGSASGVGKTSVRYRLAQHVELGITEVDDVHVILLWFSAVGPLPAP